MKKIIIISGALTVIICLVMNIFLIPSIQAQAGGMKVFDMAFNYDYQYARAFLVTLSEKGRNMYLKVQLPLDFVYPVAYCTFFSAALVKLTKGKMGAILLPVLLAVLDYAENVCTIIMLKTNSITPSFIHFSSPVTSSKTVVMCLIFVILISLFIRYLVAKNRDKKAS